MPIYEYKCRRCGEVFEVLSRGSASKDAVACTACGAADAEKILSLPATPRVKHGHCAGRGGTECGHSPCCGREESCGKPCSAKEGRE